MTKHLIIVLYFIIYTMGFSFLIVGFFGWLKYRKASIKYLLLSATALTLILLEQMVTAYEVVNIIESKGIYFAFACISAVGCGLMIYALTRLVKLLTGRTMSRKIHLLVAAASVLPVLMTPLYMITRERFLLWMAETVLFGFILYNILDLLSNMDHIENGTVRLVVRRIVAFSLMMVPILILDLFIERIPGIGNYFPYGLLSVFLFYFVLSSMGLYYMIKNYSVLFEASTEDRTAEDGTAENSKADIEAEPASLWVEYNITGREQEIIRLLLDGQTYNDIGARLIISLPTVKTHVHHIYKKMGIRNRIELVNLCRNHTKV